MMTALWLYGYAVGVTSSRKIEKATYEDVAFRVLAAGEHPHFTSINEFRATHRQALGNLFHQILQECMSAGLVTLGHVAIDGTKMKANASKHKAMSYERMEKEDARLTQEIEAFFTQADATDAEEDKLYGVGQQPHDFPAELRRREDRRAKIREVREALKKETAKRRAAELQTMADQLRAKAEKPTTPPAQRAGFTTMAAQHDQQAAELDDDDPPPPAVDSDLPRNAPPATPDGAPQPKAQRNFTDPESRIMMRDGGFLQAYNAQIAVDDAAQIIVAAALSNQAPDVEYFEPMLRRIVENCDAVPTSITADSGTSRRTMWPLRKPWERSHSSPSVAIIAMGFPRKASCDPVIRRRLDARCESSSVRPAGALRMLVAKPPSSPSSARSGLAAAFARCRFAASSRTAASGC